MKKLTLILLAVLSIQLSFAQISTDKTAKKDSLTLHGQLGLTLGVGNIESPIYHVNGRYIPELVYKRSFTNDKSFDLKLSLQFNSSSWHTDVHSTNDMSLNFYRARARYKTKTVDIKAGLQELELGSSKIFRRLQWFNLTSLTDPQRIAEGNFGLSTRFTLSDKSNILIWGLTDDDGFTSTDFSPRPKDIINSGIRISQDVNKGAIALSYNYAGIKINDPSWLRTRNRVHKFGLEGKWDLGIDLWLEMEHVINNYPQFMMFHETAINPGIGHMFEIGNGLDVAFEHLFQWHFTNDQELVSNIHQQSSALRLSYPFGSRNKISLLSTYNWTDEKSYNTINLQHNFNKLSLHLIANLNAAQPAYGLNLPFQSSYSNGPGFQIMAIYKH